MSTYHSFRKRLSLFLIAMLVSAASLASVIQAAPDPYWALQTAYNQAVESGDNDAICAAAEDILALYAALDTETACRRVIVPLLKAVKIYESSGRYNDALRLYKMYKRCYTTLDRLTDMDCSEALKYADAFLAAYEHIEPTVYVHAQTPADVPYYGAKNEPVTGTYVGMCGLYDESLSNAFLLYVQFENESIPSFAWRLPKTDPYYMLEVAWNLADEDLNIEMLQAIAAGKKDDYLKKNLSFLATLENCGVLLRFGAEVNVWGVNTTYAENGRLEEFKESFIAAFRHIHDMAEQYAPNAAMVYSPNDISNLYVTHNDFYPGDAYVDWVGLSSYGNLSDNTVGEYASMTDAYYKRGVYANQMAKVAEIIADFGDRKPIMISECGFCYASVKSKQTEASAKEKLHDFYSYINMLYPQVKAVFYFNTNFDGNQYCLFGEDTNDAVAAVYKESLAGNAVMSSRPAGSGYTRLSTLDETRADGDTGLYLALYASYPGNPTKTVTYTLDGKEAAKTSVVPYAASIPASLLNAGRHTLNIRTEVGATVYSEDYVLYVSKDYRIRAEKPDLTDIPTTHWAYPYVSYCVAEGFFDGLVSSAFRPTATVSRGMFVTLLGRAVGIDLSGYGAPPFSDVKETAYYSRYVTWAKEAGVTAGTSDTQFSPNMILTREQICAMLVRYCDNAGTAIPKEYEGAPFADDAAIADYFRDAVYRARAAGIISGKDGNRFDPKAQLTRQEISVILKNFHERFVCAAKDGSAR